MTADAQQQPEETWKAVSDGPGFEVSWDGNFRSRDRVSPGGRHLKGAPIEPTIDKDGYAQVKYVNAEGRRVTRQVHRVMLEAFAGQCPKGQQSRHYDDNPQNNRWRPGTEAESRKAGGNLFYGTGRDQHRDKVRNNGGQALPVPPPAHPCINHPRCGGKTRNPGKRCLSCVEQVGRDAADMLRDGVNLHRIAEHFGYKRTDFVFEMARKHGHYTGSKDDALLQGRKRSQRVAAWARKHLRRGDAASPPAPRPAPALGGEAGTAPFGRPPHLDNLGQVGHPRTPARTPPVTQREPRGGTEDRRPVTQSNKPYVPLPADRVGEQVRYRAQPRNPGRPRRHR